MRSNLRLLKIKKRIFPIALGFVFIIAAVFLKTVPNDITSGVTESLDNFIYDIALKLNISQKKKLPEGLFSIVIVDIDEKSIEQIGHWPWSRDKFADLMKATRDAGAIVIAFDIFFAESPMNPVDKVLEKAREYEEKSEDFYLRLQKLWASFDYDEQFRQTLSPNDTVLGFLLNDALESESAGVLPKPLSAIPDLEGTRIVHLSRHVGNLEKLQDAAANGGFISSIPDKDGVIRSAALVVGNQNNVYPSLSLEAARLAQLLDKDNVKIKWGEINSEQVIDGVFLGKTFIATDESGKILIPFDGETSRFRHLSAADVINKRIPNDVLQNAIVFVGSTSFGLGDFHPTPVNPVFPGVDVHAYLTQGIMTGNLMSSPYYGSFIELLLILLFGLLLAFSLPFLDALWMTIGFACSIVTILLIYGYFFRYQNVLLSVSLPLLLCVGQIGFNLVYGMLFEFRRRAQLKGLFGQYVPQEIVEIMSEHPEQYTMDGSSERLTVLFADVVHFTTVSEKLTPQQIRELLNRYFTPMTRIILQSGGTIDKYVGDMIMAFWGAPVKDEHHVRHALESALFMLKESKILAPQFEKDGLPAIQMGIGLNTGIMSVGDMGSEYRRAYTVLGDSVNAGSRIEGLTRFYGVDIAVGEETRKGQDDFVFRLLDRVKVKGKDEAMEIYELVSTQKDASQELLESIAVHEEGMRYYFAQEFAKAKEVFQRLLGTNETLYNLFLHRIHGFESNPPGPSWNGVTEWAKK